MRVIECNQSNTGMVQYSFDVTSSGIYVLWFSPNLNILLFSNLRHLNKIDSMHESTSDLTLFSNTKGHCVQFLRDMG